MESKFKPGDRVRIRVDAPPQHIRTPLYVQGKVGEVERIHGAYRNPESLAHGGDGLPEAVLYLVRLSQSHVWDHYKAASPDTLLIDIYEHWLEAAS